MKLLSHGQGSDLRQHLVEVMSAAESLEERILFACHDLGKATTRWQKYISSPGEHSPHHHAAAGGIFAACVLWEMGGREMDATALAVMHSGAAHHTFLQQLGTDFLGDLTCISKDEQAFSFVFDHEYGLASLLPEIQPDILRKAWKRFTDLALMSSSLRLEWNSRISSFSFEQLLGIYLKSRRMLGKLCFMDHCSAAKQSGKEQIIPDYSKAFQNLVFNKRSPKIFEQNTHSVIQVYREQLRQAFCRTAEEEGMFYFIDAPTGLGKTEAMIEAAEVLVQKNQCCKIVYAVPQVSIADQVFEEYFSSADAQIWNYRRKEQHGINQQTGDTLLGNGDDQSAMTMENTPFSKNYNVTTFNQVLLALCHPDRNRCVSSLDLTNAVIIMDEFHKLPQVILPFFFRIARKYGQYYNCRFILGSATPLEPLPFWNLQDSCRIPEDITRAIYNTPEIDRRRSYYCLGKLSISELAEDIEEFHKANKEKNLLVVVNLVGAGTWRLRKILGFTFNPWTQYEELLNESTDRCILFLDGLVPPGLRRKMILACRIAMKKRPVTLISTQMIEVGVDLDFDSALIDFQGLASIIQRGGRVGRNAGEKECKVGVFSLSIDSEGTSSMDSLISICQKYDLRLKLDPFRQIFDLEKRIINREKRFFEKWEKKNILYDSDINKELSRLQKRIFDNIEVDEMVNSLLSVSLLSPDRLGVNFEKMQFIAELFGEEYSEPCVIIETEELMIELGELEAKIVKNISTPEERKRFMDILQDRMISPAWGIRSEFEAELIERGRITFPGSMKVFSMESLIL